MEESEIELEPIQPIEPIKPEEKETTLEKVLSFDIDKDGLFAYEFLYPNDGPATDPVEIVFPPVRAVDENGNLYVQYFIDWDPYVFCVNTGEKGSCGRSPKCRITKMRFLQNRRRFFGGKGSDRAEPKTVFTKFSNRQADRRSRREGWQRGLFLFC